MPHRENFVREPGLPDISDRVVPMSPEPLRPDTALSPSGLIRKGREPSPIRSSAGICAARKREESANPMFGATSPRRKGERELKRTG